FGRIDYVFMQYYIDVKYIFVLITLINRTNTRYYILDLEIIEEAEDNLIIISITIV
ncbi:hypothetical protein QBC45DRAFT_325256, partial [Copromyces sp. CBS 386.78]